MNTKDRELLIDWVDAHTRLKDAEKRLAELRPSMLSRLKRTAGHYLRTFLDGADPTYQVEMTVQHIVQHPRRIDWKEECATLLRDMYPADWAARLTAIELSHPLQDEDHILAPRVQVRYQSAEKTAA